MSSNKKIETLAVHAGAPDHPIEGAVVMPIFQSATFVHEAGGSYEDVRYIRLNNTPNHRVLHARLAAICGGETALVTSSGMAAITTALLTVLRAGDHLVAQDCLYGGTRAFLERDAVAFGIETTFVTGGGLDSFSGALRPNTKAIYVEAVSNPLLQVPDLAALGHFARQRGLTSLIDNTFPSPVNFRPLEWGYDLELHSATKYLNGHSDIVAGAVVGAASLVRAVNAKAALLGGSLDPHACFLLERGLKTLALRVRQQNANAQALAELLEAHPRTTRVLYPGLPSHPDFERASALFSGGCGGVLALELDGDARDADAFMQRLQLAKVAPSLGGVETLVTRPATTSHAGMSPEARASAGIGDNLVRVAVGIEATSDLLDDFTRALG
jgi:cystathionine beta-lyase/cystathionine gamma-synthase